MPVKITGKSMRFEVVIIVVSFVAGMIFAIAFYTSPEQQRKPMLSICTTTGSLGEFQDCDITDHVYLERHEFESTGYDGERNFTTQLCANYKYDHEPRLLGDVEYTTTNAGGCVPYDISVVTVGGDGLNAGSTPATSSP